MTAPETTPAVSLTTAYEDTPHELVRRLREEQPVAKVTTPAGTPAWLVTRHDDVRPALADPRLAKSPAFRLTTSSARSKAAAVSPAALIGGDASVELGSHMLNMDGLDHARLRKLVAGAFTTRRVAALEPRIEAIADDLLNAIDKRAIDKRAIDTTALDTTAADKPIDLIDTYAFSLPIQVICELLGIPTADRDKFREWSDAVVAGIAARPDLPETSREFLAYIRHLLARRREHPSDDMLTDLLAARDGDDRLSESELSSMVFLLLVAGHETTVNLIANGVYLLLAHPDQLAALRADPALMPRAVEEILRYESPVKTGTFRFATEDLTIGGQRIPAGDIVLLSILAANRDNTAHDDPTRFDITRPPNKHIAFGHGPHFCLGAPLARLEGRIALTKLLARYPRIELADPTAELTWRPGFLMRGLATLPVTFDRRTSSA